MRSRIAVAAVLLAAVPVTVAATAAPGLAAGVTVSRVSGVDRYGTAAAIADAGWPAALPSGSTLLLATGQNFPDAVAGAAAAGHLGVPMLLTPTNSLSASAQSEISRLKPSRVALLGGTSALSTAVESAVTGLGVTVDRWQGADRYATAAAVSEATYPNGAVNVYLATGSAFPDALAGSALAAVAGGPLLLASPTSLPAATAAEISRLHPSAIVALGGTSAVSDGVLDAAVAAAGGATKSRISGADRYATADAIASTVVQVGGGTTASKGALLATGLDFADALSGAAWAGATGRTLFLAPGSYVTPHTWQTIQSAQATSVTVLGGSKAISDAVASGLQSGNPPTSPPAPPAPPAGSTDWPTYHHDAQRTGATVGTPGVRRISFCVAGLA